jgi:hypothetical protein
MWDEYIATPYKVRRREVRMSVGGIGEKGKSWEN